MISLEMIRAEEGAEEGFIGRSIQIVGSFWNFKSIESRNGLGVAGKGR